MPALLISSSVSFLLFLSYGILISRVLNISVNLVNTFFLGLIFTSTFLAILSFFVAIDSIVLGSLTGTAIITMILCKREWLQIFRKFSKIDFILFYFAIFLLVAFITSLFPYRVYDTGLYYLQNIQWITKYPLVPGLANLHGRFGFNPSSFLINSLTSLEFIYGRAYFSLNFTILGILIFHYLRRIRDIFKASGLSNHLLFQIIIFCSILGISDMISSPTPDFIATSLLFYIFSNYVDLQLKNDHSKSSLLPLIVISFYLITVKLSTVPILILFFFIIFDRRFNFRFMLQISLLGGIIILPWLIRNVVLTGWLLYPFPSLDLFSFDWQVPKELVILEKRAITGWARVPGERFLWAAEAGIREWFPVWWNNLGIYRKFLITGSVIFPLFTVLIQKLRRTKILKMNPVVITAFSGVIFWFLLAPDIRFGKAFIIVSLISPLLILRFSIKSRFSNSNLLHGILGGIFLVYSFTAIYQNRKTLRNLDIFSVQEIPKPKDLQFKIYRLGDQAIYIPITGDRCYNHQLPCTTPTTNLNQIRLRSGKLKDGFKNKNNAHTINKLQ